MKSHSVDTTKELTEQRDNLLKVFDVLKALGTKPSTRQVRLLYLTELKIKWTKKSKLARTKLMKYDRQIKRLTKKLGKV